MIVGLATATMVESTMIMKKPSIIAHSAAQGFPEKPSPVTRLVAVLMYRTSFRLPRISRAGSSPHYSRCAAHCDLWPSRGRTTDAPPATRYAPLTGLCEGLARHVSCWTRVSLRGRHPLGEGTMSFRRKKSTQDLQAADTGG